MLTDKLGYRGLIGRHCWQVAYPATPQLVPRLNNRRRKRLEPLAVPAETNWWTGVDPGSPENGDVARYLCGREQRTWLTFLPEALDSTPTGQGTHAGITAPWAPRSSTWTRVHRTPQGLHWPPGAAELFTL